LRQLDDVAVDLGGDGAARIDDRRLRDVVEPLGRRAVAETEGTRQRRHILGAGGEETPARLANAVLARERRHRCGRIERLIEADTHDIEAVGTQRGARGAHGLGERLRRHRAGLETTRINKADDERLAAVVGQAHAAPERVSQRETADAVGLERAADRTLAVGERLIPSGWRLRVQARRSEA